MMKKKDFWDSLEEKLLQLEKFFEKGFGKVGAQHWFARLIGFLVLLVVVAWPSYLISPTLGCISIGLFLGLAVGILAATRFPSQLQAASVGALGVWLFNGIVFGYGPEDPTSSASGVGNFLTSIVLSAHGALAATQMGPPPQEAVARAVFAFLAAVLMCLLFSSFRQTKHEPPGMFATCDFDMLSKRVVNLLVGQWKYYVINSDEKRTHWGYCCFSTSGPMMQLSGMRICSSEGAEESSCRIPWRASFLVYTNEPRGRFLQFEYNIRLSGKNLEAYSKVDLVHLQAGRMTGTYDHLAGGEATGRIEFEKEDDSPHNPIEEWKKTSDPTAVADAEAGLADEQAG